MAKTPKKLPGTVSPDSSTPPARPVTETLDGTHRIAGSTDSVFPAADQPFARVRESTDENNPVSAVSVSNRPATSWPTPDNARRSITWPADQVHLLRALTTDSDLFISPDGKTYAYIENEGHFLVERQQDGRYQVPFDFTPDLPGPFLHKISGQSSWRFELPAWLSADSPASLSPAAITARASAKTPSALAPHLAARLSDPAASAQGIRYDKHRKTYVDTAEGTVMVGKNAEGEYQQTFASELKPSGERVEQIPGTNRWRRKVADATSAAEHTPTNNRRLAEESQADESGPGKRPRLAGESETLSDHHPDTFSGDRPAT
ncbi:hypothetical protein PHLH6_17960 [Pseudomonas sp. Seg1]|uniref:hypothetical protein n=1 Tax=Pseudomonas sp. Seg1 TaxID=2678259 RepID=UPI001BB3BD50|nr:hypothetical protein [Pseudomonas sp. Seg1]BBP69792.1 hypothetical protein PHLH6_17960 [Pseudomonas sp. Seg1]